jgi:UDP-glucose 4-epimerase
VAAVRRVTSTTVDETVNVGRGVGYTVFEVLDAIGDVTGLDTTPTILPRRPGDAASMVASTGLAEHVLGWKARMGLIDMVESAWRGASTGRPGDFAMPSHGEAKAS